MGEKGDVSQAMDAVLMALGWRGRYQLLQVLLIMMCIFAAAFNILSIVFIGKSNPHKCLEVVVENSTSDVIPYSDVINVTYGTCSVTWVNVTGETTEMPCPHGMEFEEPIDRSLMSEWGLVCEKEALTDVSQTLLLAGMMVGATVFTSLSDRYGRKPLHVFCSLGLFVTGVALAFVPSYNVFLPLRIMIGAFQQGMGLTSGILCMEILPARFRFAQSVVGGSIWATSMIILGFLAYLMREQSWRHLQLLVAAFSAYSLLLIFFLDESLRWLVANGRVEQAERVLQKAAARNKVSPEHVLQVFRSHALTQRQSTQDNHHHHQDTDTEPLKVDGTEEHFSPKAAEALKPDNASDGDAMVDGPSPPVFGDSEQTRYGLLDFFRHKHVFMCAAINGFVWLVNSATYYGLSMTSVNLADDMYLGFLLSAIVELPAVLAFFLAERIGRKKCCDIFHTMAGLSLLGTVVISSVAGDSKASGVAVVVLSLVGKFAISATFAIVFLYTPEQFPTNLRNAALGVASTAGRIGGMVAPYSRTLVRHYPWAPGTIFGVSCLLLPLCMRLLPETCGRELPQTIRQMELYISQPYTVTRSSKSTTKAADNHEEKRDVIV